MEQQDAITKMQTLLGKDLVPLAERYDVTIWRDGKKNNRWAGHTIERHLGIQINSVQPPNGGAWELRIVPLKRLRCGKIAVKKTMAITSIDPYIVSKTPFEQCRLLDKLQQVVVCARLFESQDENSSLLVSVATFDLTDPVLYEQVRKDYEAYGTV